MSDATNRIIALANEIAASQDSTAERLAMFTRFDDETEAALRGLKPSHAYWSTPDLARKVAAEYTKLTAERDRLAAQLETARALLMDCWHQLDGDVYVLPGGEVHPGAVTTIHALHAFLWPEGKTI